MKRAIVYMLFGALIFTLTFCNQGNSALKKPGEKYLNLADSVKYVGMETCRSCHANIFDSYIHTGMGQSFDWATKEKSKAKFDEHALVYDPDLNFYYKPFWKGDELHIMEFRLENGDTIHKRTEKISYVVGSGQHTNSHLMDVNGYVYQAPITFYTQEKRWDLAPGFESGANSRFSRVIAAECMTCHNHFPKQVSGSMNKYTSVPRGIQCERCHGPGEIHVREKLAGNIVDTSKMIDYSIVTPTDLPVELEIDVCQRCHLQGTAVLRDGKTFYDFKPGMRLNDIMQVFLPRYSNAHDKFIMASQADRMRLSQCFKVGKVSCTTCHNPHQSVEATSVNHFNDACLGCHSVEKSQCTAPESARALESDNCVKCHMPKSGSIDIPHVRITDHNISIPVDEKETQEIARFIGLECLTEENPGDLAMAKGYLALYDKFVPEKQMLDSAGMHLNRVGAGENDAMGTRIHYYFNFGDYDTIIRIAEGNSASDLTDAWTAYRIGEAFSQSGLAPESLTFFQRAVELMPFNLEFNNKLGTTWLKLEDIAKAEKVFEFVLNEDPRQAIAQNNLGFIRLLQGKPVEAERYYREAIALDPDYEQALLNMIGIKLYKKDYAAAKKDLEKFLSRFPENGQALQLFEQLKEL